MPDNWIGTIELTNRTELLASDGTKLHDYIPCNQGAGVPVNKELYPVLWDKLGGKEGDALEASVVVNYGFNNFSHVNGDETHYYGESSFEESSNRTYYVRDSAGTLATVLDDSNYGKFYRITGTLAGNFLILSNAGYGDVALATGFSIEIDVILRDTTDIRYINLGGTTLSNTMSLQLKAGSVALVRDTTEILQQVATTGTPMALCVQYNLDDTWELFVDGASVGKVASSVPWTTSALGFTLSAYYGATTMDFDLMYMRLTTEPRYAGDYTPLYTSPQGESVESEVPNLAAPAGSPHPYKIIADKT